MQNADTCFMLLVGVTQSTLVGVLTAGHLDNGRGAARSRVFVHQHEAANGRTSCISQHVLGISASDQPVHQSVSASASAVAKTKSWHSVVSQSKHVVTLIDLAGHERYLKTTIAGLTGLYPDYAFVIINSLAGITRMTKEHLGVTIMLNIPLAIIVTKIDLVPPNVLETTKKAIDKILKSSQAKKLPIHIRTEKDVETVTQNQNSTRLAPIFYASSVTGVGLDLINMWLAKAKPRTDWRKDLDQPASLDIDETFMVTGVGVVVSGTLRQGILKRDDVMLLGPYDISDQSEQWRRVSIRTIHCKRIPVDQIEAGTSCAMSLRAIKAKDTIKRTQIRRGMVLLHHSMQPSSSRVFEAEVLILHHPTTIKLGYQAVVHAGIVRQTASIVFISTECLRTGDRATCRFRFLMRDEYIRAGTVFVFREGSTKGLGRVTKEQSVMDPEAVQQAISAFDPNQKHDKATRLNAANSRQILAGQAASSASRATTSTHSDATSSAATTATTPTAASTTTSTQANGSTTPTRATFGKADASKSTTPPAATSNPAATTTGSANKTYRPKR